MTSPATAVYEALEVAKRVKLHSRMPDVTVFLAARSSR
jgi:hypothetical protein